MSKQDTNNMSTALEPVSDVPVQSEDGEDEMELESQSRTALLVLTASNGGNESTVSNSNRYDDRVRSTPTTSTTSTSSTTPSLDALKESIEILEINNMSNDEQGSVFTTDSVCTQDVIDHIVEMGAST